MIKVKTFLKTIRIIYDGSPKRFITCLILLSIVSLFSPLYLLAVNNLITALTNNFSVENIIGPLIFFMAMILITNSKRTINLLGSYLWITAEIALQKAIIQKATSKSLTFYDTPSFYNSLVKANQSYGTALSTTMMFISAVFVTTLSVLTMTAYLAQIYWMIGTALLLMVGFKIISYVFTARNVQKLRNKQASEVRKNVSLADYICKKETRILGATSYFFDRWKRSNSLLVEENCKVERKNILCVFIFDSISYACYGLVLILAVSSQLQWANVDVADTVVLFVAMETIFISLDSIVLQLGNVLENISLTEDLFNFLSDSNDEMGSRDLTDEYAVSLKEVEFSYPLCENITLKSINVNIRNGENIAIVGKNGAGKSTLVKLMIGLYKPTKGIIEFGISLDLVDGSYENITAVFQEINAYCLTLGQNIAISDVRNMDDTELIEEVFADLFEENSLSRFSDGVNTKVGREFGGIDLSGGEKQRLAIGRAMFRDNTLSFFDEPSSAIDPLAEDKIYEKFLKISKEKTTFFITHRLSSVRFADRILLVDGGEIIEQGSHDELIAKDGQYAFLYNLQKNDFVR